MTTKTTPAITHVNTGGDSWVEAFVATLAALADAEEKEQQEQARETLRETRLQSAMESIRAGSCISFAALVRGDVQELNPTRNGVRPTDKPYAKPARGCRRPCGAPGIPAEQPRASGRQKSSQPTDAAVEASCIRARMFCKVY